MTYTMTALYENCLPKMLEQFRTNIFPQLWHMLPFYYSSCLRKMKHSQHSHCVQPCYRRWWSTGVRSGLQADGLCGECSALWPALLSCSSNTSDVLLAGWTPQGWAIRLLSVRSEVVLLHDNLWPHTSMHTTQTITKCRWTLLPHPPCRPNLTPSDTNLSGPFFFF